MLQAPNTMDIFEAHPWLGRLTPQRFLKTYWHRKPLFVKRAFDPSQLSIEASRLFELARRDDVESRLVRRRRDRWQLSHGPFPTLPNAKRDWTLLIQGVDLHDAHAERVLDRFRWLPAARLDDVMISHAVDGGGVGPHFDSYDVFLLQARGTRRWRVSMQRDLNLVDDLPLKILANFTPTHEFICEPGDLLYLPPRCAHDGVALNDCMTWSIGFRAPTHAELLRGFYEYLADDLELDGRYRDAGLELDDAHARVPARMVDTLARLFDRHRPSPSNVECFLGEYLSEPKASTLFEPPLRPHTSARWLALAQRNGLRLDARTRMLYDKRRVFINGDSLIATAQEGRLLRVLADRRRLDAASCRVATEAARHCLYDWYRNGWLHADTPRTGAAR